MRLTIVTEDNVVGIDNIWFNVDCSELIGKDVRALQWYESYGIVETFDMSNIRIESLDDYQSLIAKWEEAKLAVNQQQPTIEEINTSASAITEEVK